MRLVESVTREFRKAPGADEELVSLQMAAEHGVSTKPVHVPCGDLQQLCNVFISLRVGFIDVRLANVEYAREA